MFRVTGCVRISVRVISCCLVVVGVNHVTYPYISDLEAAAGPETVTSVGSVASVSTPHSVAHRTPAPQHQQYLLKLF